MVLAGVLDITICWEELIGYDDWKAITNEEIMNTTYIYILQRSHYLQGVTINIYMIGWGRESIYELLRGTYKIITDDMYPLHVSSEIERFLQALQTPLSK